MHITNNNIDANMCLSTTTSLILIPSSTYIRNKLLLTCRLSNNNNFSSRYFNDIVVSKIFYIYNIYIKASICLSTNTSLVSTDCLLWFKLKINFYSCTNFWRLVFPSDLCGRKIWETRENYSRYPYIFMLKKKIEHTLSHIYSFLLNSP